MPPRKTRSQLVGSWQSDSLTFLPVLSLILFTLVMCKQVNYGYWVVVSPLIADYLLRWCGYDIFQRIDIVDAATLIIITLNLCNVTAIDWLCIGVVFTFGKLLCVIAEDGKKQQ